ncbi:MAG: 16S rRNA (adenine(1518)-N(6)/adenine(1519)-N(6))-dimethyltransferase RsmA [Bdellovibrionota bacterium]
MSLPLAKDRLKTRMQELSHYTKKALGQNFLVSDTVIGRIIQAVDDEKPEKLLEIGPGLGALTDLLIGKYGRYQMIELDSSLVKFWESQNMPVMEGDALQADWTKIDYDVLVSNLPYQISSSIVIDRCMDEKPCRSMILMFQKEVAQRIRARHNTDEYGLLTVIAQEFWDISMVSEAGPRDFNPAPKVASRVLKFKCKESPITDKKGYLSFVKTCFKQRRRILKSNLESSKHASFLAWVEKQKISEKVRSEELSIIQIRDLYFHLKGG